MRKFYAIFLVVLLSGSVFAQSPQKMSYQAVIRNLSNQLVTTQVGMQISILQGTSNGTPVYVETQTPTPNANGLVSIEIGSGTPVTGTFAGIDWSAGPYFIKTETATAAPLTTYTITGTSQLLSVPYALYAKTAGGHYVGELYGGGIVVAVWKVSGVEHGLIASLVDLSPGIIWTTVSYQSTTVPGGSLSPINGLSNSNAIVAQAGAGTTYAAGLCRAYTATGDGGLVDWYLPAAWELNQCYNAAFVVNTILGATNGFKMAYYFSSTENGSTGAETQEFVINGYTGVGNKDNPIRVRAVRRF
jgi:hypothetical protein